MATPPITKITLAADLVLRRGSQGVRRVTVGWELSNERVAAGFENHGIIRQIKLERIRPFLLPPPPSTIGKVREMD